MGIKAFVRNKEVGELERVLDEGTARLLLSLCRSIGINASMVPLEQGEWAIQIDSLLHGRRIGLACLNEGKDIDERGKKAALELFRLCEEEFQKQCAVPFRVGRYEDANPALKPDDGSLRPDVVIGLALEAGKTRKGGEGLGRLRYFISYSHPISSWFLGRDICAALSRSPGLHGRKWEFLWGHYPMTRHFHILNRFPVPSVVIGIPRFLAEEFPNEAVRVARGIVDGTVMYFRELRRKGGLDDQTEEPEKPERTERTEEPDRPGQGDYQNMTDDKRFIKSGEAISEYAKKLVRMHQGKDGRSTADEPSPGVMGTERSFPSGIFGTLRKKG